MQVGLELCTILDAAGGRRERTGVCCLTKLQHQNCIVANQQILYRVVFAIKGPYKNYNIVSS